MAGVSKHMKALSLVNKVKKLGGSAEIISEERKGYDNQSYTSHEVVGELNGYDVHMHGLSSDYYTVRAESKRGEYDPGSDYNPGGYSFCHRLNELEYYARQKVAA